MLSVYWYRQGVDSVIKRYAATLNSNIQTGIQLVENTMEDINCMQSTIIYKMDALNYIFREEALVPTEKWFDAYGRLYNNMRVMNISNSRWVSGSGIFNQKGFLMLQGTISEESDFFTSRYA